MQKSFINLRNTHDNADLKEEKKAPYIEDIYTRYVHDNKIHIFKPTCNFLFIGQVVNIALHK